VDNEDAQIEQEDEFNRKLLMSGLQALGSIHSTLNKTIAKIEHNHEVYRNRKKPFIEKIREFLMTLFGQKHSADLYVCKIYHDGEFNTKTIEHDLFVRELDKKAQLLRLYASKETDSKQGNASNDDLFEHLCGNIYDLQRYSRLLAALDEFFKTAAKFPNSNIKDMKPEISTIKTALSKAMLKKEYYRAGQKLSEQTPATPE
jgi:hypothetical protein